MIRILHTGDVHLDSPFAGLGTDAAMRRRRELRETFSQMMAYAAKTKVDLVLIAGDLFDRRFATGETVELLREEFARLECPVVISPGNHDPADGKGVWESGSFPDNVYIFKEDALSHFSFDSIGVDVYGYAFTSAEMTTSPVAGEIIRNRDKVNILLCHADMTSPVSSDAPLSKAQIEAFGADYTALGHIHNGEAYSGEAGGRTYAYCGCPEGRDFGECGPKGAIIAEISTDGEEKTVKVERRTFCRRRYEDVAVAIDGAVTMGDVCRILRESDIPADENIILRLTLTGVIDPGLVIDASAVEDLFGNVSRVTVRDRTTPSLIFSENDLTVRGEYCRLLKEKLSSADPDEREMAVMALRFGMTALSGNDI